MWLRVSVCFRLHLLYVHLCHKSKFLAMQTLEYLNRYGAGLCCFTTTNTHTHIYTWFPLHRHLLVYTVLMGANNGPMLGLQWQFMMDVREFNWE